MKQVQYRCRACPLTFTNAEDSNAHHDATGHFQTSRCPKCDAHLSSHSPGAYAECMGVLTQRGTP